MTSNNSFISFSPSTISKFLNCKASSWFSFHQNELGELEVDTFYADIGNAIHQSLLEVQKYGKKKKYVGDTLDRSFLKDFFDSILEDELIKLGLNISDLEVQEKLISIQTGIIQCIDLVISDLENWYFDKNSNEILVWEECWLDHDDKFDGVYVDNVSRSKTRADVVGIYDDSKMPYVIVRDYKTGKNITDPAKDPGLLMRGIWSLLELQNPSASWFIKDRNIDINVDSVVLEAVNLGAKKQDDFIKRVSFNHKDLLRVASSFSQVMGKIDNAKNSPDQSQVAPPSPGGLCKDYCPHLHRCDLGKIYVSMKFGIDTLENRTISNQEAHTFFNKNKSFLMNQLTDISMDSCPICHGSITEVNAEKPTIFIKKYLRCINFVECGFQMPSFGRKKKN